MPVTSDDVLRVADFSRTLAGTYAAQTLAWGGARVLSVQNRPAARAGDPGPGLAFTTPRVGGVDVRATFNALGRRRLALDMATDEGRRTVDKLLRHSDVVLHNFRPSTAAKIGLTYGSVAELNPRVVHCSISGFGASPTAADWVAFDESIQAAAGIMRRTRPARPDPSWSGVTMVDFATALFAVIGIQRALRHRDQTGRGCAVSVSLFETAMALHTWSVPIADAARSEAGVDGEPTGAWPWPACGVFETLDDYIYVGCLTDSHWAYFRQVAGQCGLAIGAEYDTSANRYREHENVQQLMAKVLKTRTTRDWLALLDPARLAVSQVASLRDALDHPAVVETGLLRSVQGTGLTSPHDVRICRIPVTIVDSADDIVGLEDTYSVTPVADESVVDDFCAERSAW